jgi:hypothetical protein
MIRRIPIPGVCAHARNRMAERLGRDLTRDEWLAAVAGIVDRRLTLLGTPQEHTEHWLLELPGLAARLVWRTDRGEVVTVTPASWPTSAVIDARRRAPPKKSLRRFAHYRGGERLPGGTQWVGE